MTKIKYPVALPVRSTPPTTLSVARQEHACPWCTRAHAFLPRTESAACADLLHTGSTVQVTCRLPNLQRCHFCYLGHRELYLLFRFKRSLNEPKIPCLAASGLHAIQFTTPVYTFPTDGREQQADNTPTILSSTQQDCYRGRDPRVVENLPLSEM